MLECLFIIALFYFSKGHYCRNVVYHREQRVALRTTRAICLNFGAKCAIVETDNKEEFDSSKYGGMKGKGGFSCLNRQYPAITLIDGSCGVVVQ